MICAPSDRLFGRGAGDHLQAASGKGCRRIWRLRPGSGVSPNSRTDVRCRPAPASRRIGIPPALHCRSSPWSAPGSGRQVARRQRRTSPAVRSAVRSVISPQQQRIARGHVRQHPEAVTVWQGRRAVVAGMAVHVFEGVMRVIGGLASSFDHAGPGLWAANARLVLSKAFPAAEKIRFDGDGDRLDHLAQADTVIACIIGHRPKRRETRALSRRSIASDPFAAESQDSRESGRSKTRRPRAEAHRSTIRCRSRRVRRASGSVRTRSNRGHEPGNRGSAPSPRCGPRARWRPPGHRWVPTAGATARIQEIHVERNMQQFPAPGRDIRPGRRQKAGPR